MGKGTKRNYKTGATKNWDRSGGKKAHMSSNVPIGSKGFLCTCSGFEREAVREAYNLLDEYAEKLRPKVEDSGGKDDFDDDFDAELAELRTKSKGRFRQLKMRARGVIFIQSLHKDDDPVSIAEAIFEDKSSEEKSTALSRIVPISTSCKAFEDDVVKAITALISQEFPKFKDENLAKTYSVEVSKRSNDSPLIIMSKITGFVRENFPAFRTEPKSPSILIVVEVVASTCLLSVVPYYPKFRHFKLRSEKKKDSTKEGL